MITINKMNYEQFALDYIEGTLDTKTKTAMEAFLAIHPDVKAELEEMELYTFDADEAIVFEGKETLIKTVAIRRIAWWQYATAAIVLIGVGFWLAQLMQAKQGLNESIMAEEKLIPPSPKEELASIENEEPIEVIAVEEEAQKAVQETVNPIQQKPKKRTPRKVQKAVPKKPVYKAAPKAVFAQEQHLNKQKEDIQTVVQTTIIKEENTIIKQAIAEVKPATKEVIKKAIQEMIQEDRQDPIQVEQALIAAVEPIELEKKLPEISLENIATEANAIADVTEDKAQNKLQKMGLLPSGKRKRFSFKNLKEALLPEAMTQAD